MLGPNRNRIVYGATLTLLISLIDISSAWNDKYAKEITWDGCYCRTGNMAVRGMAPFDRLSGLTEQQCLQVCTMNCGDCKSVQYNCNTGACDMFCSAVTCMGRKKRQSESPTSDGTSFAGWPRLADDQNSGNTGVSPVTTASPAPSPSFPNGPTGLASGAVGTVGAGGGGCTPSRCSGSAGVMLVNVPVNGRRKRGGRGYNNGYRPQQQGYTYQRINLGSNYAGSCSTLIKCPGVNYYLPTGKCIAALATPPPATDTCPSGKVSQYFLYDGYKMSAGDKSFTVDSDQSCVQSCTTGRKPDGGTVTCQTADFDTSSKTCTISSQVIPSDQLQQSPGTKHYQRICVDSWFGQRCPGPYLVDPQHILIGYAQSVTNAGSMEECLQICADSQNRFGFQCVSGMYYLQSENNCILNKETRGTQPDKYVVESQDKVNYFELNCNKRFLRDVNTMDHMNRNRNVIRIKTPQFGNWTMCDKRTKQHYRFKECSTGNPKKCGILVQTCDPNKENIYDSLNDIPMPNQHSIVN